jgi:hypothetical protein
MVASCSQIQESKDAQYKLSASYLEVYNEQVGMPCCWLGVRMNMIEQQHQLFAI